MRCLLIEDLEKYNSLEIWMKKNWDNRSPDLTKEKQKFVIDYCIKDLDFAIISYKIQGKNITDIDIIKSMINSRGEYVVSEIKIIKENNDYKTYSGYAYPPNDEFMIKYNELKYFDNLKLLALTYLDSLGYYDKRNFYEENGNIYYGIREKNKYDAHLLGDIISGEFVMSSKDYDSVLINFKNKTYL